MLLRYVMKTGKKNTFNQVQCVRESY